MVTWVSIAGTALAIFLIMTTVMMEEIEMAPYAPESNRDRWLVQRSASISNTNWGEGNQSNGGMSYNTIKKVFYAMEIPEAVTATEFGVRQALLSDASGKAFGAPVLGVDHGFWKVMDFTFISGSPIDEGDFESATQVAVISESTARRLFGTPDAAGREFQINHAPYRVKGVVRDVTTLAKFAYSDVWIPYSTTFAIKNVWNDYMGSLSVIILPASKDDIPAIREEYADLMAKLGDEAKEGGWEFILRERPYDQETQVSTPWSSQDPDMGAVRLRRYITWAILLLVPAVNLSSMTHSRLSKRREEIGVRRAFGARRSTILSDLFIENLIITLVAGIIGLVVSLLFARYGAETIFAPAAVNAHITNLSVGMLFSWKTFGLSMIFCLILNVLSATLPAWQASRTNIVNAIAGKK